MKAGITFAKFHAYLQSLGVVVRPAKCDVQIDVGCEAVPLQIYENHVGKGKVFRRPVPNNYRPDEVVDLIEATNICSKLRVELPDELRNVTIAINPGKK